MAGGAGVMDVAWGSAALAGASEAQRVVLVEGGSDKAALEVVARRRGQALGSGGTFIVAMGGATNIGHFLTVLGPRGTNASLAGLCDAGQEDYVRSALERGGLGSATSRAGMEALGFYVCTADLEDELIRAVGTAAVEAIIEAQGELQSWRTLQKQPAQQGRTTTEQLHRFMGTRSGRKSLYARLLAEVLDPASVPRPLDRVLAHT
ncbi:MAG TPA: TOPRIM nucleotidyl transferase/hydrolase domain-containing protein [Streptosporangiaceae bacterium]|nr:TOPRIM nucleotidyl transferase/hydrolase domain-containing protein [Streptosporangiaceae bacterium]